PSFQKHSAERNENRRLERKLNTTGSAGACGCAHASTVLVVPKSRPRARAPPYVPGARSAIDLHAGLLVLLAQLRRRLLHRLEERIARHEGGLELVLLEVFLPRGGVRELLEAVDPVRRGIGGHLRGR